jgi:cell shape-determining protein MreC
VKSPIQKNEKTWIIPFTFLGMSLFLIVLSHLSALNFLRSGISFVVEPISYASSEAGNSVKSYFSTFSKFSEFNVDYNLMKEEILRLEIENSDYSRLLEENEALKTQIDLGNLDNEYLMTKIVSGGDTDSLKINMGSEDDVEIGDVVSVGNMFVGIVESVDLKGSYVRLPSNTSSNLKVIILDQKSEDLKDAKVLSKAVVSGTAEGIKVENILMNADIENGDIVVINDERVGEYLILGYLVNLSDNPATTSRYGYVSTLVDYDDLMTVFVKLN